MSQVIGSLVGITLFSVIDLLLDNVNERSERSMVTNVAASHMMSHTLRFARPFFGDPRDLRLYGITVATVKRWSYWAIRILVPWVLTSKVLSGDIALAKLCR